MQDKGESTKPPQKQTANIRLRRKDLAVFVDVVFEVVVLRDDGFGDERMVGDADGGHQGGSIGVGQPRNFCGLLIVLVVQVEASLHGRDLSIWPSEEAQGVNLTLNKCQHLISLLLRNDQHTHLWILVIIRLPQLMKVTISPSENVSASAPSIRTLGPYQTSFIPTSAFW